MSGGVGFADDALDAEDFTGASEACRYLGLSDLADVILRIHTSDPERDDDLHAAYDRLVPRHQVLVDAFERRLAQAPDDDFDSIQ